MPDPPSVRCYDAVYSPEIGHAHLLLEDVSKTHFRSRGLPPLKQDCERFVDCLANFTPSGGIIPDLERILVRFRMKSSSASGLVIFRRSRFLEEKFSAFATSWVSGFLLNEERYTKRLSRPFPTYEISGTEASH